MQFNSQFHYKIMWLVLELQTKVIFWLYCHSEGHASLSTCNCLSPNCFECNTILTINDKKSHGIKPFSDTDSDQRSIVIDGFYDS